VNVAETHDLPEVSRRRALGHVGRCLGVVAGRVGALLPGRADYRNLRRSWRGDILAGITVGVVALPLALAFGITTGLGARAGLITAIVAGLVAGIFGGSNVQVSGPTGAMTVVLVPVVARYGADAVYVVGLLAGLLVLVASFARLGRLLAYVPWPVVEGFTVGIAVIIFLQQVPHALGVPKPEGENAAAVAARAVIDALHSVDFAALATVAITIGIMIIVPRVSRTLPASLLAVVAATAVAEVAGWQVARIGTLPSSLPTPTLPSAAPGQVRDLLGAAVAVALLVALESLLSARVADGMTDTTRHDPDRELFGQGLANLASPLFGGMPATGAIARTAVNVRAGARTRVSAITHSIVLVVVVLVGGSLVGRVPLASLAGVLMITAIRMVEIHNVRAVLWSTPADASVMVITAGATIAFDLIVAVELGIALAASLALLAIARSTRAVEEPLPLEGIDDAVEADLLRDRIICYRIDGPLFFGAAQQFLTELTAITDAKVVILRLPDIQVLDATGARAVSEIIAELEARDITVLIKGPRPEHLRLLDTVGALDRLAHDNHLFENLDAAMTHARQHAHRATRTDGGSPANGPTDERQRTAAT
jgi:SulP family sulfate permease